MALVLQFYHMLNLFCLFVCGVKSHSRNFHPNGDVTITDERLQILTYTRNSWSLSSEGFLRATPNIKGVVRLKCHLQGPVAHIIVAERLAVELLLHVLMT